MKPSLAALAAFQKSPEFSEYRNWVYLDKRVNGDPAYRFTDEDREALNSIYPRQEELHSRLIPQFSASLDSLSASLAGAEKKYADSVASANRALLLGAFYKSVLEELTSSYLTALSDMLTEVYQSTFSDTTKRVLLTMDEYRGKNVVKFQFSKQVGSHAYMEELVSQGGSVTVVLGIITEIYFLLVTGGERIIFIDEELSALASDVLARFLAVLRHFRDDLGFCFLVISHDYIRFLDFIDKAYTIDSGVYREVPVSDLRQSAVRQLGLEG